MEEVKAFIEDILSTLGEANDEEVKEAKVDKHSALFSKMLRKILGFNRPRLEHYIRLMAHNIEACIESVQESEDGDSVRGMDQTTSCLLGVV